MVNLLGTHCDNQDLHQTRKQQAPSSPSKETFKKKSLNSSHNLTHLELKNNPFSIPREALMELPKSTLLGLFHSACVLSQNQQQHQIFQKQIHIEFLLPPYHENPYYLLICFSE